MPLKRPVRRRRKPSTPRWWAGRRLTAYGREAVSVLVLVGTLFLREHQAAVPPVKREEEAPPDVWAVDLRGPEAWWGVSASARLMPPRPFPEQKRPPCMPGGEAEVNGGCWIPHRADAPCPGNTFEHAGRCFIPVRAAERLPTSFGK